MGRRTWSWIGIVVAMTSSCAGARPARSPGSRSASPAPAVTGSAVARPASHERSEEIASDQWRVSTFPKFDERAPVSVERWAKLEHAWDEPCGPGKVIAQRRLCLPKGRYVFESQSSDHVEVTIDGRSVIAPRIELSRTIGSDLIELSRPIEIAGCVLAQAEMSNRGCYPQSRLHVVFREARKTEPCDETSYPTGAWNACIFAGRRQEELIEKASWKELVSPWAKNEGPTGWEDNFSVEARTTACFEAGKYVFHARAPADRLNLFLDDALVLDPRPATPRNVVDSDPMELRGCHELRATYSARDRDTSFEVRWAKVGSALERRWASEALACDPACSSGARCVAAAPFGIERKGARICLPQGRPGELGEACDQNQRCRARQELGCCRPDQGCGHVSGVCTYHDR